MLHVCENGKLHVCENKTPCSCKYKVRFIKLRFINLTLCYILYNCVS